MAVVVLTVAVLHAERLMPRREKAAPSARLAAQGRSS
jgi:hypothetical protein